MKKGPIKMWIGVDPDDVRIVLPWSLTVSRSECRSMMNAMSWNAGRVRRVTLTLSPPPKPRRKK
jgi:hypothetical protein